MKRKISIISVITLALFIVLNLTTSTYATEVNNTDNNFSIGDSKYIDGTYKFSDDKTNNYLPFVRYSSSRIIVDKELTNSGVMFSKGDIDVTSKLSGMDLLFSSDTVRLSSATEFPIIFADNVVIDSDVTRTTVIFANTITITQNAKISEDLICYANKIDMLGTIHGSLLGGVSTANISGTIDKDLRIRVNDLKFYDGQTKINGNVYVKTTNQNLNISNQFPNARIYFEKTYAQSAYIFDIALRLISTSLIFALLYIIISRRSKDNKFFNSIVEKAKKHPVLLVLSGALNIILLPLVILILIVLSIFGFAVITIPALLVYGVILTVSVILSTFIVGSAIYAYLSKNYLSNFTSFWYTLLFSFLTYLIIGILCNIPVIGSYISLIVIIISIGLVFLKLLKKDISDLDTFKENDDKDIKEELKEIKEEKAEQKSDNNDKKE